MPEAIAEQIAIATGTVIAETRSGKMRLSIRENVSAYHDFNSGIQRRYSPSALTSVSLRKCHGAILAQEAPTPAVQQQ